jgi:hypothetical protein
MTLVEPMPVEISTNFAWTGESFRQYVAYGRARPELDPPEAEFPRYLKDR